MARMPRDEGRGSDGVNGGEGEGVLWVEGSLRGDFSGSRGGCGAPLLRSPRHRRCLLRARCTSDGAAAPREEDNWLVPRASSSISTKSKLNVDSQNTRTRAAPQACGAAGFAGAGGAVERWRAIMLPKPPPSTAEKRLEQAQMAAYRAGKGGTAHHTRGSCARRRRRRCGAAVIAALACCTEHASLPAPSSCPNPPFLSADQPLPRRRPGWRLRCTSTRPPPPPLRATASLSGSLVAAPQCLRPRRMSPTLLHLRNQDVLQQAAAPTSPIHPRLRLATGTAPAFRAQSPVRISGAAGTGPRRRARPGMLRAAAVWGAGGAGWRQCGLDSGALRLCGDEAVHGTSAGREFRLMGVLMHHGFQNPCLTMNILLP
jgi:hypothetical protein